MAPGLIAKGFRRKWSWHHSHNILKYLEEPRKIAGNMILKSVVERSRAHWHWCLNDRVLQRLPNTQHSRWTHTERIPFVSFASCHPNICVKDTFPSLPVYCLRLCSVLFTNWAHPSLDFINRSSLQNGSRNILFIYVIQLRQTQFLKHAFLVQRLCVPDDY